jgi:hypothetical protein
MHGSTSSSALDRFTQAGLRVPLSLCRAPALPFELCFFALALAAFLARGLHAIGAIFGVAVVMNTALLGVFGDWRE